MCTRSIVNRHLAKSQMPRNAERNRKGLTHHRSKARRSIYYLRFVLYRISLACRTSLIMSDLPAPRIVAPHVVTSPLTLYPRFASLLVASPLVCLGRPPPSSPRNYCSNPTSVRSSHGTSSRLVSSHHVSCRLATHPLASPRPRSSHAPHPLSSGATF